MAARDAAVLIEAQPGQNVAAESLNEAHPFTLAGLGAYGMAAAFYIVAIKKLPITLAFPSVSLSYAAVAIIAHYLWSEPLGLPQLGGIALIAGGIFLLHQV